MHAGFAAVLLALAPAAYAADAPAKPRQQFLEKSHVEYPTSLGPYSIVRESYDPSHFSSGVTTEYSIEGVTANVRLNVFIYPHGRADEEAAIASAVAELEASVLDAQAQKLYSEVNLGERTHFAVVAPESSILSKTGERARPIVRTEAPKELVAEVVAGKQSDPILQAIAENVPSGLSRGRRQSFGFTREGVRMRSLGYVFYRNLFFFKVRLTAPESAIGEAEFRALGDAAARTLVPAMDVQNFGDCGTITFNPRETGDKEADAQAGGDELIRGMSRIKRENCANDEGRKPTEAAEGFNRQVIVYPAGTWK